MFLVPALAGALLLAAAPLAQAQMGGQTAPSPGGAGTMQQGAKFTEPQIKQSLQAQGFTDIQTKDLGDNKFEVQAKKNGESMVLLVDAVTGRVERLS
jgi:hypothetical protein